MWFVIQYAVLRVALVVIHAVISTVTVLLNLALLSAVVAGKTVLPDPPP